MAFDKKAWEEKNREKVRLYSVRSRLRKKGLDLSPELLAQIQAEREAKKASSKERERERKRRWAAANKERKNVRYRERYHSDPEFRAKEIAKRIKMKAEANTLSEAEKEAIKAQKLAEKNSKILERALLKEAKIREKQEQALKARKERNARLHAEAMAKAAKITPKKANSPQKHRANNFKKPGRLVALAGWIGW